MFFSSQNYSVIDSAGRLSSGLLEGRFTDLGQFKECIKSTGQAFSGRYCHAFITIPEDLISLLSVRFCQISPQNKITHDSNDGHYYRIFPVSIRKCIKWLQPK